MALHMLSNMNAITFPGVVLFLCLLAGTNISEPKRSFRTSPALTKASRMNTSDG